MKIENPFGLPMSKSSTVENDKVNLNELLFGKDKKKDRLVWHLYLTRRQYWLSCNGKSRVKKKWNRVRSKNFRRAIKGTLSGRLQNIVTNSVLIKEV